jgi:hypothetical protein
MTRFFALNLGRLAIAACHQHVDFAHYSYAYPPIGIVRMTPGKETGLMFRNETALIFFNGIVQMYHSQRAANQPLQLNEDDADHPSPPFPGSQLDQSAYYQARRNSGVSHEKYA